MKTQKLKGRTCISRSNDIRPCRITRRAAVKAKATKSQVPDASDVIVIGSGLGGLCCAAIVARYGYSVTVLESHTIAGGCAHSFERNGFMFDSGPSFFAGINPQSTSNNALKQILDLIGEEVDCAEYTGWKAYLPEGTFDCKNDEPSYISELFKYGGEEAVSEWKRLSEVMKPIALSAEALSFANFRNDLFAPLTISKGMGEFVSSGVLNGGPIDAVNTLNGPFSYLMRKANIQNEFLKNLIDLECFVLSGLPASGTLSPEMAYMYQERHKGDSVLDYPIGGTKAVVDALIRGIEKYGGRVFLGQHVKEITMDGGRASGIMLSSGQKVSARKNVVSNASIWDTYTKLLPEKYIPQSAQDPHDKIPYLDSFMHLHLGIDGRDISDDTGIHHLVVNDWKDGVDSVQNVINISIPTMLDKSLAPQGKHVVHAYTAANEPYQLWEGMDRKSKDYKELKEKRAQCLWLALEKVIPDIRQRVEVKLVGSPLTHERFARRARGTYGPGIIAGKQGWPTAKSAVDGLLLCGDSTFPGIGVPAVAASGFIAANTIANVKQHLALLEDI